MSEADPASAPDPTCGLSRAFDWNSPRTWLVFIVGSVAMSMSMGLIAVMGAFLSRFWHDGRNDFLDDALFILPLLGIGMALFAYLCRNLVPKEKRTDEFNLQYRRFDSREDYFLFLIWMFLIVAGILPPYFIIDQLYGLAGIIDLPVIMYGACAALSVSGRYVCLTLHVFGAPYVRANTLF